MSSFPDPNGLSIPDRARALRDLQRGSTDRADERRLADIFLATCGADLFELKRLHDSASTYRDLVQLLYRDIDDRSLRGRILGHFEEQAAALGAGARGRKVISDIDDTLWCNWKDARYPKQTVYPGVLAFLEGLRPHAGENPHDGVAFLTARPRDRAGLVERLTHRRLRSLGIRGATVLSGALHKVLSSAGIAEGKLENLLLYRSVYPESELVLVGDSGQGDVALGLAAREKLGDAVRGVFIHDVVATPEDERSRLRARGIHVFDTYAGAAARALEDGLLSAAVASQVARAAREQLAAITFPSGDTRDTLSRLLERDLEALSRAGATP